MSINFELLDAAIEAAANRAGGVAHQQHSWISPTMGTEKAEVCGTAMCLAGFTAVLCGAKQPAPEQFRGHWFYPDWWVDEETLAPRGSWAEGTVHVAEFAEARLGLANGQASALFEEDNTLDRIRLMRDYLVDHPEADYDEILDMIEAVES